MAKNKTFHKKKTLVVFLGCMLMLTALIGRLVNLMVVQSEYYAKKADDLHERERKIKAARGRILDANGVVLADNKTVCTISLIHSQIKEPEKVIVFYRKGLLFAFNFNTTQSFTNILVPVHNNADYTLELSSDDEQYGGQELVKHMTYHSKKFDGKYYVELYLPARTAIVLKEGEIHEEPAEVVKEEIVKETKTDKKK